MIETTHGLILGGIVFFIGLSLLFTRANIIMALMGLELMLASSSLNFVFLSYKYGLHDGQIMSLFILVMAAAEVTIGLAFAMAIYRHKASLDLNLWSSLKDSNKDPDDE